jgi:hypothetical protein
MERSDTVATQPAAGSALPAPVQRKIIRNGDIDIRVDSLDSALKALRLEVEHAGGYCADETHAMGEDGARHASVTVRLPAGTFDGSLAVIQALGHVERLTITGEDITEQYYDLEIQLRNRRQLETRLLALLERSSNKLSELLEIEREVGRIRGEIDSLEGKKRFWDAQVSMSKLVVTLHEPVPMGRGGLLDTFRRAFRNAGDNMVEATAGLIALAGGLLPVLVVTWLCWLAGRAVWRRRTRNRARTP